MPIVEMNVDVNASSENRNNMHVLPTPEELGSWNKNNEQLNCLKGSYAAMLNIMNEITPESPISNNLNSKS